ncbi:uncharacterized protein Z518_01723 [Rhinocladiella mackenziei CBS 650.93]|uniref:Rhinocladiella mackenziei CBS 650.93 unplaced genomic scaffold supercont1.1, whole genome shotgun sequence n=1 Tax=Rhinocladiella mackenziei CBS 650.93 TaxID=1442369 RepID=A0A0D2IX98_9EURO|nr:uncharacterized protein Z518_01723 [Rhinocladiella mackenziei CBS 650.93]KIX10639.1 hypothetical protein Z518_01723 [Rhinocladiella mackenziei CBS 650.93]
MTDMASQPGPVMEFLGRVAYEFEIMRPLLPTYLHLLVSAIFPIYTAAHASLARPSSAAPPKRKKSATSDEEHEEDESQKIESLTPSDAILFPLLAGGTLATLYFILKWLQDPAWLNWILGIYFSQIGLFFAVKFLKDVMSVARSLLFPTEYSSRGHLWKVDQQNHCFKTDSGHSIATPFPGFLRAVPLPTFVLQHIWNFRDLLYTKARFNFHLHRLITVKGPVEILDVASLILSCAIVYYHGFVSKPWFLTNFLGFSFCYGSLQYMTPTTAWTGTLVLCALFFYDIYFVFFTPMMVTVATKLDVPIKLLFPRPDGCIFPVGAPEGSSAMEEYLQCLAETRAMAMLGLGDIVVPGMMLAFALRFDLYLHYLRLGEAGKKPSKEVQEKERPKPVYVSAKGSWGEQLWTSSKFWSTEIKAKKFLKPYFYATIVGYLAGMITTVVVMQIAEHAQPALLYLVPGVLLSLWGTALVKGDLKALWQYSELPEDEANKKSEGKKSRKEGAQSNEGSRNEVLGNGDVEVNGREIEPAKAQEDETQRSASKDPRNDDGERKCRRLVSFSITLPSPRHGEDTPSPTNEASLKANTAQIEGEMDGFVSKYREQRADGEPPEKRARGI